MKYIINEECRNFSGLFLKSLETSHEETILEFKLTNMLGREINIDVHPSHDPEAFWIIDNENNIRYKFTGSEGIPLIPEGRKIASNETVYFKLFFEPLENITHTIDIIEGPEVESTLSTNWVFTDISLQ